MKVDKTNVASATPSPTRRKFLAAGAGAGALAFPMISKGQTGPLNFRFQSTWPQKDIFHEYAQDYAKIVNDMTGGDLKIEVLPAGAVVPALRPFRSTRLEDRGRSPGSRILLARLPAASRARARISSPPDASG